MVVAGTTLVYTMTIANKGPSVAQNVILSDTVSDCLINPEYSRNQVDYTPWTGSINLGALTPNATTLVYIRGIVSTLCSGNLVNTAIVSSTTKDTIPQNNTSTVTVAINPLSQVSITKSANSNFVEVGKNLTYTVNITNKSVFPVDVKFIDVLPNVSEYIPLSFNLILGPTTVVNNTTTTNLIDVDIFSLLPQSIVLFSYKVKVLTLPNSSVMTNNACATSRYREFIGGPIINEDTVCTSVSTSVILANLEVRKVVNESIATIGNILHYTVYVVNTGNVVAQNVIFNDNIPLGTEFVQNSMKVNGTQVSYRPDQNVNIGNILPGQIVTIEFDVKVVYIPQPPYQQQIENVSSALFNVSIDGILQERGPIFSNTVTTELVKIDLRAIKTVDKINVNVGDTLTYTVVITNNSDIAIDNVILTDTIPQGTILVGNQPVVDVNLGTIQPKESKTVTFMVNVVSRPCPPKLVNKATVTGSYVLQMYRNLIYALQTQGNISIESNEVVSYVDVKPFKQFSIDTIVKIPPQKPEAEDILQIISKINIICTSLIKTPIVTSHEGQVLTGWKLIVEGIIVQDVVYVADEPTQSVHAAEFEIPFSSFIVLSKDYNKCKCVRVTSTLENNCYSLGEDKRSISQSFTIMIRAII